MIRTLVVASLLLAGCSPAATPAPANSPTAPSDGYGSSACARLIGAMARKEPSPPDDLGTATRAVSSTDPGIQEAGKQLASAAKEAGDLWVQDDPTVDKGPAYRRLADAQQGLLAACTKVYGEPPWAFVKQQPTPTPSR